MLQIYIYNRCPKSLSAVSVGLFAILLPLMFFSINVAAQSNVLFFNEKTQDFDLQKGETRMTANEKILIQCDAAYVYDTVRITAAWNDKEQSVVAALADKKWTAVVGPFPPRTNVLFTVYRVRKLSPDEIQTFQNLLVDNLNAYNIRLIKENLPITPVEYQTGLSKQLTIAVQQEFENSWGEATIRRLSDAIFPLVSDKGWTMKSDLRKDKVLASDFYVLALKMYGSDTQIKELVDSINADRPIPAPDEWSAKSGALYEKIKQTEGYDTSTLNNIYKDMYKGYSAYLNAYAEVKRQIVAQSDILLKKETVTVLGRLSQAVAGIHSYIGFDMGLTYIQKISQTPFFITVSPYLKKIEVDKDYRFNFTNFFRFITPTFGINLNTEDNKISPIYFVGVGCRLNKVARIAVGETYYLPTGGSKYEWSLGVNASVNTNYLVEFISAFNMAKELKNK